MEASAAVASTTVVTGSGATAPPAVGNGGDRPRTTGGHVLDHALAVHACGVTLDDHLAQVQHRDPIGHGEDVVQVVGDHEHREAVVTQVPDQLEHHRRLRHTERCGGFVHDDQLGVPHHRPGHGHRLPLAARKRADRLADGADRRHLQARQGLGGRPLHGVLVEQAVTDLLAAEEHVLDDVQVVGQREVLVDGLDPEFRGIVCVADADRAALPEDVSLVGLVCTRDALDQHRLARAVVTTERGDPSGGDVEVHFCQGLDRPEALGNPSEGEQFRSRLAPRGLDRHGMST
jgi:hypothetical protein